MGRNRVSGPTVGLRVSARKRCPLTPWGLSAGAHHRGRARGRTEGRALLSGTVGGVEEGDAGVVLGPVPTGGLSGRSGGWEQGRRRDSRGALEALSPSQRWRGKGGSRGVFIHDPLSSGRVPPRTSSRPSTRLWTAASKDLNLPVLGALGRLWTTLTLHSPARPRGPVFRPYHEPVPVHFPVCQGSHGPSRVALLLVPATTGPHPCSTGTKTRWVFTPTTGMGLRVADVRMI